MAPVIQPNGAAMSLLGQAALAMWWDMAPEVRPEFEDWHSHEHFPERMSVPGFLRGTRWTSASESPGIFVLYELAAHETLSSPAYVARLNAPTPWSTKMMPHHRNMVRAQCHVLESAGSSVARHMLTVRFSAPAAAAGDVQARLKTFIGALVSRPGLTGAHVLRHRAPELALTTEQKIRPVPDAAADWVFLVCGYDVTVLTGVVTSSMSEELSSAGVAPGYASGLYSLSHSATPRDVG